MAAYAEAGIDVNKQLKLIPGLRFDGYILDGHNRASIDPRLVGRYKLHPWTVADLIAPGIALGHVVGRFGCLLAGCCYGRPTSVPWAITFTNPAAATNVGTPLNTPLHPTQLYDAGAELLIMGVLLLTEKRGRPFPGRTFWLYMLLYAISRYIVEIYRGDERGMILGVSTSQFVSILIVPLSIIMLLRLRRAVK